MPHIYDSTAPVLPPLKILCGLRDRENINPQALIVGFLSSRSSLVSLSHSVILRARQLKSRAEDLVLPTQPDSNKAIGIFQTPTSLRQWLSNDILGPQIKGRVCIEETT